MICIGGGESKLRKKITKGTPTGRKTLQYQYLSK